MQITRNSLDTNAGPERLVHRRGLRRHRRGAVGRLAGARELRPLHSRRAHRVAHAPERPDDLGHSRASASASGGAAQIEVIRPGDRVFFEPGEDHWHGAAPTRFMTHLAMLQVDEEGNSAAWGDHVSDEEYAAAPAIGV